jgi:hypothetical protein
MAITDEDQYNLTVLELKSKQFLASVRVFQGGGGMSGGDEETPQVDAMVITQDETSIIVSSMINNDIHIYDIKSLKKTRTITGQCLVDNDIHVYDIKSLKKTRTITGPCLVP